MSTENQAINGVMASIFSHIGHISKEEEKNQWFGENEFNEPMKSRRIGTGFSKLKQ